MDAAKAAILSATGFGAITKVNLWCVISDHKKRLLDVVEEDSLKLERGLVCEIWQVANGGEALLGALYTHIYALAIYCHL
jgi:hypothetical protein